MLSNTFRKDQSMPIDSKLNQKIAQAYFPHSTCFILDSRIRFKIQRLNYWIGSNNREDNSLQFMIL